MLTEEQALEKLGIHGGVRHGIVSREAILKHYIELEDEAQDVFGGNEGKASPELLYAIKLAGMLVQTVYIIDEEDKL